MLDNYSQIRENITLKNSLNFVMRIVLFGGQLSPKIPK